MHPTVYASYHTGYGIPNGLFSLEGIGYKKIVGVSAIPSSFYACTLTSELYF